MKPRLLSTARLPLPLATVIAGWLACGPSAFAANVTWDGDQILQTDPVPDPDTRDDWQNNGNWTAAFPVAGDTATFNAAGNGNTTIDMDSGAGASSINFDTASVAAYTLGTGGAGSQTFTLGNGTIAGTIRLTSTVTNDQLINANITLGPDARGASYNFTNDSGKLLTVDGGMAGGPNGSSAGIKGIYVSGAGDTTFSGVIANGGATGISLDKTGSGTLTLSGSSGNLRSGSTTVKDGKLVLNKSSGNALPVGTLTINNATVQCASGAVPGQIANQGARLVLANAPGTARLDLNGQNLTLTSGNYLTFFGTTSSGTSQGSITTGAGTLTLAFGVQVNNNNHPLGATISGNLDLGLASGRRAFDVADSAGSAAELDIPAVIANAGGSSYGFNKTGAGVMRLSNANNTFGGPVRLDAGTLEFSALGSLGTSANSAGNLSFYTNTSILRYIGSLNVTSSRGFTTSDGVGGGAIIESSGLGTLSFDNTVTIAYMTGGQARSIALGGTHTGANTFGKIIANNGSLGAVTLNKTGVGTWVLNQANTYTGGTNITGGKLTLGVTHCLANTSNVSIGAGTLVVGTGVTDIVGTLDCTAAATINLGDSSSKLAFADGTATWTGSLTITGTFVPGDLGSLRFGTGNTGLTGTQLSQITATGWTNFGLDANGYLTADVAAGGTPYSTWAGTAAFGDDANGDGVANGLAWLLGADGPSVSALEKLPKVSTPTGFLQLIFTRKNPHSPARLYVEYGNDLVGWTKEPIPAGSGTFGGNLEVVVTSGAPDQLLLKIPTSRASGGKLFARLGATEN